MNKEITVKELRRILFSLDKGQTVKELRGALFDVEDQEMTVDELVYRINLLLAEQL